MLAETQRLTRLYRCKTFRWVADDVMERLESLLTRCRYDPAQDYAIGDRLHHHLFGAGTVEAKEPVDKVRVRFDDGSERVLRERLREDVYWRQPAQSPSIGESYTLGYAGSLGGSQPSEWPARSRCG